MTSIPADTEQLTGADAFLATNPTDEQINEAVEATRVHGEKLIAELNRRAGFTTHSVASLDRGCICRGNWRLIIAEHEHLFDRKYKRVSFGSPEELGQIWTFTGVVWASDDLYYLMNRKGETYLLTCVGSIEGQGFELLPRPEGCTCKDGTFEEGGCQAECSGRQCGCKQCADKWHKRQFLPDQA